MPRSRYLHRHEDGSYVVYGYDFTSRGSAGYFVQVFDFLENSSVPTLVKSGDTRKRFCMGSDEHMHRSEIVEILEEEGAPKKHVRQIVLDVPLTSVSEVGAL